MPQDTVAAVAPASPQPRARSRGYAAVRAVGVGVTGFVVLAGVLSAAPDMVRRTQELQLAWPAETVRLEIEGNVGSVLVREAAELEPGIELEKTWAFEEPRLETATDAAGVTSVRMTCPVGPLSRCHGDWSVVVPAGMPVSVTSQVGDVELVGVTGDVVVDGAVGEVMLSGAPATADVRSSVGRVTARLTEPPTLLRVRTSVGDVDLTVPAGTEYAVHTTADRRADVVTDVEVDPDSPHVVDVRTSVGSVRIDDE